MIAALDRVTSDLNAERVVYDPVLIEEMVEAFGVALGRGLTESAGEIKEFLLLLQQKHQSFQTRRDTLDRILIMVRREEDRMPAVAS